MSGLSGHTSVAEALHSARIAITASGSPTARLDAELLLADILGVGRERLHIDSDLVVVGQDIRRFQFAVRRRAMQREPVAYILGRKGFRNLELTVDRRALIPRPETETLVEVALGVDRGATVLDVGTGSGAVALACKDERPDLDLIGLDISDQALSLARENAARLGLDVGFHRSDLLEGYKGPIDTVVANLPYVSTLQYEGLSRDIRDHEPLTALVADRDGLALIERLIDQVAEREQVTQLAVEVGVGQAAVVAARMERIGLVSVSIHPDLAGIDRVVAGRRS